MQHAQAHKAHKSTNGGMSRTVTNSGNVLDGNPVLSFAGSFQGSSLVYAATSPVTSRSNVFRTTNGGRSWIKITADLPDRYPTDLAVDPNSDRNVFITFGY